jgi:hypothetical protein
MSMVSPSFCFPLERPLIPFYPTAIAPSRKSLAAYLIPASSVTSASIPRSSPAATPPQALTSCNLTLTVSYHRYPEAGSSLSTADSLAAYLTPVSSVTSTSIPSLLSCRHSFASPHLIQRDPDYFVSPLSRGKLEPLDGRRRSAIFKRHGSLFPTRSSTTTPAVASCNHEHWLIGRLRGPRGIRRELRVE